MNDQAITCRFVFTSREARSAQRCYWRYTTLKWWFGVIILIPIVITLCPVFFPDTSNQAPASAQDQSPFSAMSFFQNVLPIILFVGLMAYLFIFKTLRSFRKGTYFNQEMTYTFRDVGVHLETPRVQSDMKWEIFPRVVENQNGFVLFNMGKQSFNWFPKSGFTSRKSIDQCRELFRKNVKDSRQLFAS